MSTVGYMQRTRDFYAAQGYPKPYVWASHDEIPFTRLAKPLSESRLGLITTAALYARKPFERREVASGSVSESWAKLYAEDLAWAKESTHMDDIGSYFPLRVLQEMVSEGGLGEIAPRFHCAPTEYSQRQTNTVDAPDILARCREDAVDVALLVPL